jgi:hypothetical protein
MPHLENIVEIHRLGNPIDLRADKALPRKRGRRPLMGRKKAKRRERKERVFMV